MYPQKLTPYFNKIIQSQLNAVGLAACRAASAYGDGDDDGDDDDGDDDQDEEEELCEAINDHEMPDETFTFQLSPDLRPALAPPDFCYHCH